MDDGSLSNVRRSWVTMWILGFGAMLPLLIAYLVFLWRFEHYRYFPFAILLSGYLIWLRWDRHLSPPENSVGWLAFAGSLLLLIAGGLLYSPWLGAVASVLIAGAFLFSHRSRSGERLVLAWLPLLTLLRLPLNYDQHIVAGLQQITTKISSYLLDLFRISHDTLGNVIRLPDRDLLVAEACSGVQSAFTLCFVAIAIIAWKRRPLIVIPFALGMALLWALMANVVRVTAIAVAATVRFDLADGWPHELLGYAVLLAVIGLVTSTDQLLRMIFHPIGTVQGWQSPNPLIRAWDTLFQRTRSQRFDHADVVTAVNDEVDDRSASSIGRLETAVEISEESTGNAAATTPGSARVSVVLTGVVVILGLMANLPVAFWTTKMDKRPGSGQDLFFVANPSLLDGTDSATRFLEHQMVRDGEDPRLGRHADMWKVSHPRFQGEMILSQPYRRWHDLSICYKNRDWQETSRFTTPVQSQKAKRKNIGVSTFRSADGIHAYLLYTGFSETGQIVDAPDNGLFRRTVRRCRGLFGGSNSPLSEYQNHAMLQLWITTPQELSESAITEAIGTFGKARDRFAEAIKKEADSR